MSSAQYKFLTCRCNIICVFNAVVIRSKHIKYYNVFLGACISDGVKTVLKA